MDEGGTPEDARFIALSIEEGFLDYGVAVRWADKLHEKGHQDAALLDIMTVVHPNPLDMIKLLCGVAGEYDPVRVLRRYFGLLREKLRKEPGALERITLSLESLAISETIPRGMWEDCYGFSDALTLANAGQYGTVPDVLKVVQAFLQRNAIEPGLDLPVDPPNQQ